MLEILNIPFLFSGTNKIYFFNGIQVCVMLIMKEIRYVDYERNTLCWLWKKCVMLIMKEMRYVDNERNMLC